MINPTIHWFIIYVYVIFLNMNMSHYFLSPKRHCSVIFLRSGHVSIIFI